MKNEMFLLSGLMLLGVAQVSAQTTVELPSQENKIVVVGTSEREIVPNEIYMQITISESDSKQKHSVERLESDMLKELRSLGVNTEKDLTVGGMGSNYAGKRNVCTSKSYELKVASAAMLDKVVSALESVDVSNIVVTKVSHTDLKNIYSELRSEAVNDAKDRAINIGTALGQKVFGAVFVEDYGQEQLYFYVGGGVATRAYDGYMKMSSMESGGGESEIEFSKIKLNYQITAKFYLNLPVWPIYSGKEVK